VVVPAAGLSQGRQLAFYAGTLAGPPERPVASAAPAAAAAAKAEPTGGYAPLGRWLDGIGERTFTARFAELEAALGRSLPASARRHRPWWANSGSVQARGWLGAGWRVAAVDLATQRVTFQQART
jgi:hypothetical protein